MRMISHFHREARGSDGAVVAIRYFSLECELAAMRGVRIPQITVTVQPESGEASTESVDPDPDTVAWLELGRGDVRVRELLDRLAGRFDGRPIGELAVSAASRLPDEG